MSRGETDRVDPRAALGMEAGVAEAEVRRACVEQVRQHLPDRDQEQFEHIRDAYDELRDPRRCASRMLVSVAPFQELLALLDGQPARRRGDAPAPARW